jgi:hypothetical protein
MYSSYGYIGFVNKKTHTQRVSTIKWFAPDDNHLMADKCQERNNGFTEQIATCCVS